MSGKKKFSETRFNVALGSETYEVLRRKRENTGRDMSMQTRAALWLWLAAGLEVQESTIIRGLPGRDPLFDENDLSQLASAQAGFLAAAEHCRSLLAEKQKQGRGKDGGRRQGA